MYNLQNNGNNLNNKKLKEDYNEKRFKKREK